MTLKNNHFIMLLDSMSWEYRQGTGWFMSTPQSLSQTFWHSVTRTSFLQVPLTSLAPFEPALTASSRPFRLLLIFSFRVLSHLCCFRSVKANATCFTLFCFVILLCFVMVFIPLLSNKICSSQYFYGINCYYVIAFPPTPKIQW